MKQILNNILNANSWLFLELVIITVVAWAVFEPAVVNLYYRSLPLGYDNGQLLYAETEVNGSWDELVDGVPQDPYEMTEKRRNQILRQLTSVEGVESAYLYEQEFGAVGYSRPAFNECVVGGDTLYLAVINFNSDAHFFETYGLKPLPGSPSAAELSRLSYQEQQVVLTHSGPSPCLAQPMWWGATSPSATTLPSRRRWPVWWRTSACRCPTRYTL